MRSLLKEETLGSTMFIVAQRIGTIKDADKIIVLEDGKIAGMGTHDDNKKNVPQEVIEEACRAVGLEHFIKTLPEGYDTILNDKLNLSAGQKQQLTIARAMIKDAPMLILDEATSSVDTRTELVIQKAMDQLMIGRTSFVIAHRLSTIKNADVIFVLKDGDILESGTHDELMAKQGFYADLYNSQFDKTA